MQPPHNPSPPSSMETHLRKPSSGDTAAFSFPSTPGASHDSSSSPSSSDDFEFGCLTPDSPSGDPNKNSPADHLFFNGRLLPHAFPSRSPAANSPLARAVSRSTSRTSSVSSKDYSLVSSRSNSTNSSCSSSARTSSSDNSERRSTLSYCRQGSKTTLNGPGSSKVVSARVYGSSQRWQFMAPVPALSRDGSRRRKVMELRNEKNGQEKKAVAKRRRWRLGRRLFRWFVTACNECHAIEPSRKDGVSRGNVNLPCN
ncbi:hypothetical protein L484_009610 [Morus notabilis]|uniref:Membrane-associated kinase regulator 1 n=1 Tax=Morus notabilis TaxID=981085 RepID=W9S471_9ROSA|nr:uncharacterized protein LOC21392933 [Morus notabilis]EXC08467.1 hypothetical protein L484_009610 [Morus notabilis]